MPLVEVEVCFRIFSALPKSAFTAMSFTPPLAGGHQGGVQRVSWAVPNKSKPVDTMSVLDDESVDSSVPLLPDMPLYPDMPPFPDASESPRNHTFQLKMRRRCCHSDVPKSSPTKEREGSSATSPPISLPKSHIHRTPSELQLASEIRRANDADARMWARIVLGMNSQIQRDFASGGHVHPQSWKSLQGVIKAKMEGDQDLKHQEQSFAADIEDPDDEWSVSHVPINDELIANQAPKGSGTDQVEDDCIFEMEL